LHPISILHMWCKHWKWCHLINKILMVLSLFLFLFYIAFFIL